MKTKLILYIGWIVLLNCCYTQPAEAQIYTPQDTLDQSDWVTPMLKSMAIPGYGQLTQERLPEAMLFYFSSVNYYYRSFFHLYHFAESDSKKHRDLFKVNLFAALFLHSLNVIDAVDATIHDNPTGWRGGLLDDKPIKSPWGAAIRSAMIPGWGQVYNESYWKAAGYLAVDSYLIYRIVKADRLYRDTKKAKYNTERSDYSWFFGLAYLITMADAYTGAYLFRFDDAMRLTIVPEVSGDQVALGIKIQF